MEKLPLDDPRWWPMQDAIELRKAQTGDLDFAAHCAAPFADELTKQHQGKLSFQCGIPAPSSWIYDCLRVKSSSGLAICAEISAYKPR